MSNKILWLLLGLSLGAAAGFGAAWQRPSGDETALSIDVEKQLAKAREDLDRGTRELELARAGALEAVKAQQRTTRELGEARAEVSRLAAELEQFRREHEEATAREKEAMIQGIMDKVARLKKSSFQSFLSPGTVAELVAEMKALGEAGVLAAVSLLTSDDENERMLATQILGQMNDPAAVNPLRDASIHDANETVANLASHSLMRMEADGVVPALREVVAQTDGTKGAHVNALWGLCKNGDAQGIETTLAYWKDESNSKQFRYALGHGLLVLDTPAVMPIVDQVVSSAAAGGQGEVLQLAVSYYTNVHDDTSRARLEALVANAAVSSAVVTAAQQALANW